MLAEFAPYLIVLAAVWGAVGVSNRADQERKRVAQTLSEDDVEAFRKAYWKPRRRTGMPPKYFEYAAAVDRYRRITFTACFFGFATFAGWAFMGLTKS
ncbi:MAG: hypothetical protein AAFN59_09640 [Pseudomonadota bacterium]